MFSRFFRPVNRLVFQNPPDSISSAGAHPQRRFQMIVFYFFVFSRFRLFVTPFILCASLRLRAFASKSHPLHQKQPEGCTPTRAHREPVVKYAGALMHHAQNYPDSLHSILHAPREETLTLQREDYYHHLQPSPYG